MKTHIQQHDMQRLRTRYQRFVTVCERNTDSVKAELKENGVACETVRQHIARVEETIRRTCEQMNRPTLYPELRFEYLEQIAWLEAGKKEQLQQLLELEKQRTTLSLQMKQSTGRLNKTQEQLKKLQQIQQQQEEQTLLEYWSNYHPYTLRKYE
ncbi:hypothetical protein [Vibrio sp. MEBiC08052]|uniref:hypothetical protein n=1 Tax=Vibrio sp. MEBiC08052 TaxID=1761910 RepID=UPI00074064F9|nr:hypothetical protein [Vibrio sp. MEBiC08052]KUI97016.1 hypothetical protein VRK_38710 [Vibrio sp. MEBiC08052]